MSTKAYALCLLMLILGLHYQVNCDWVEISQNHYTKEPLHNIDGTFEVTTKPNRKYINQSLTERKWNRGVVDRVSYVGNARRVPFASVKTTTREKNIFNEHFVDHTDSSNEQYVFISVRPNVNTGDELRKKPNTTTERGLASVDRFRDDNTPKKIPVQSSVANSFTQRKIFNDKIKIFGIDKRNQTTKSPSAESTNNNKEIFNVVSLNDNLYTPKNRQIHRNSNDENVNLNSRQTVNNILKKSPKIKLIYQEKNADEGGFKDNYVNHSAEDTISGSTFNYLDSLKYKSHKSQGHVELVTKFSHSTPAAYIDKTEYNIKNENKSKDNINANQITDIPVLIESVELLQSTPNKNKFSKSKDIPNANNGNTMNGIWKLMKVVTDIIYKNTHRSFDSKIKYLERLKSTILTSIEDQIDIAWPDDALATGAARRTRSAQARAHLEFPSSESTLMTISFLTFAVFLIKLVLQVIHTYKNKTMMVAPTVVAAVGRAAAALKHQYQST